MDLFVRARDNDIIDNRAQLVEYFLFENLLVVSRRLPARFYAIVINLKVLNLPRLQPNSLFDGGL